MKSLRDISLIKKILFFVVTAAVIALSVLSLLNITIEGLPPIVEKLLSPNTMLFVCLALEFLVCLISFSLHVKVIFCIVAFLALGVGGYFLGFRDIADPLNQRIVIIALLAFQVVLALYTSASCKGIGLKIFELAIRVGLSVALYVLLPQLLPEYFASIDLLLFVIYLANAVYTLISLLFRPKKNGMLIAANFLLLLGSLFYALSFGGLDLLGISGAFANFVEMFNWGYILVVLGGYVYCLDLFFYEEISEK